MIPADPHNTREITVEHSDKTRSSVITELLSRPRHVPGYTGHVPGLKDWCVAIAIVGSGW